MVYMIEKIFRNTDMGIELTSFVDNKQNIWFRGREIAEIFGYSNVRKAISIHVDSEDKQLICWRTQNGDGNKSDLRGKYYTFLNESGSYSLALSSKLETAKKFKQWVTSQVLPSIRKYEYKLFDSPWNKMIIISSETDLHYKVVDLIRKYYPDSMLIAGLGENQDTDDKRLDSYQNGYTRGQPDLLVLNYHKDYKGLCIEFKSPSTNYHISEAQKEMKKKYRNNGYAFGLSNDYDRICMNIHDYMKGIRVPCKYCIKHFYNKDTLKTHYRVIHKLSN